MNILWDNQLSVGDEAIDSEHQNLIRLTNALMHEIRKRKSTDILQAFLHLENELRLHFAHKKRVAQTISFDFSTHELAQQYALSELQFMKNLLATKKCMLFDDAIEHFICFLKRWMIDHHIIMVDMRLKHALQTYPHGLATKGASQYLNSTTNRDV